MSERERQRERHTERQRDTERQRERQRDREAERHRETETQSERERERDLPSPPAHLPHAAVVAYVVAEVLHHRQREGRDHIAPPVPAPGTFICKIHIDIYIQMPRHILVKTAETSFFRVSLKTTKTVLRHSKIQTGAQNRATTQFESDTCHTNIERSRYARNYT